MARDLPSLRTDDAEGRAPNSGAPLPARGAAGDVRGARGATRARGGRIGPPDRRTDHRDEPGQCAGCRRGAPARDRARRDAVCGEGPTRRAADHDPPRRRHPVTQDLAARLRRVEQQIRAFKQLHESELQMILDELADVAKQVEDATASERASAPSPNTQDPADPAAASPKRAKWLAEPSADRAVRVRRARSEHFV